MTIPVKWTTSFILVTKVALARSRAWVFSNMCCSSNLERSVWPCCLDFSLKKSIFLPQQILSLSTSIEALPFYQWLNFQNWKHRGVGSFCTGADSKPAILICDNICEHKRKGVFFSEEWTIFGWAWSCESWQTLPGVSQVAWRWQLLTYNTFSYLHTMAAPAWRPPRGGLLRSWPPSGVTTLTLPLPSHKEGQQRPCQLLQIQSPPEVIILEWIN